MVKIDIKNKINYKNFTTILSMLDNVDKIELSDLYNNKKSLNKFCNLVKLKNIDPNIPLINLNIEMKGRYNIIELTDIPKGELNFNISKKYDLIKTLEEDEVITDDEVEGFSEVNTDEESDGELLEGNLSEEMQDKFLDELEDGEIVEDEEEIFEEEEVDEEVDEEVKSKRLSSGERYSKKFFQNKKINLIMKKLVSGNNKLDILHIKDRKTNKLNIKNIPLEKGKIIYLENLRKKDSVNDPLEINLSYSHGNLILVLDRMNTKLKITNNSNQFERCSMFQKEIIQEVEEERLVEGFNSSNYYCTSGGEIIIILAIIYLVYRAMTAPEIIKIFK